MASKRVTAGTPTSKSRAGSETAVSRIAKRENCGGEPRGKAGTTEKQKEANRRNAQKSSGPRTTQGKRNSCFNAVSHGLTARSVLLPGEDPAELAGGSST